jgi:hypothetical protein
MASIFRGPVRKFRARRASEGAARENSEILASSLSDIDKCQKFLVDLVLMRCAHAMGCAIVDLEGAVLNQLGRKQGRVREWDDLVVVPMQDQCRHVKFLEILGKIRLGNALIQK